MPYFLIDGVSIYDKLNQPKFHTVVFAAGQSDYQELKKELEQEYAELVDLNVIPLQSHVTEIFGVDKSFYVLLRPDNYIGYISQEISSSAIRSYLSKFVEH